MYSLILVPLDGSPRAEVILPHVEALARSFSAEVIFLIVVEPSTPMTTPHGSLIDLELIEQTTEQAEVYLAGLQGDFQEKGIKGRRFVEYGPAVDTIARVAQREQVDLIAMASHGRSGLARVFYGSVTAGLLQRVDRPLLLIRSQDERS